MLKKIIAVAGPTASGKTALAIELAKRYDGEIVSCDSMQIYRRMDIGTAKPDADELAAVPHHMIDVAEPWETCSVADFVKKARAAVDDVLSRSKLPILAGGTGLYMDSVLENIVFEDFGADPEFRDEMQMLAEKEGVEVVHRLLAEKDPVAAEKIHPNNVRRVIRALEVCRLTGKTFTQVNLESRREPMYNSLILGIDSEREVLYERINRRVDKMLEDGLLREVEQLREMGIGRDTTAMQAIGYKELLDFLEDKVDFETAVENIKMESRRYAKRQLTWFRRNEKICWVKNVTGADFENIFDVCDRFLMS
ncbi:MAG: tRNA (adenosine(37)-N6)-dimethylallyltransferase MiaA [Clostridia bacterium]|nr:tRNA (adenosine(37)-N6)-dimethylallyltransferase MiaA [Clostridia bacterium]